MTEAVLQAPAVAKINGDEVFELPHDLYIPPEALKVVLSAFEGPLDLLLYLIKKQNLDILNIPIVSITEQYIKYIEMMHEMNIELASEYLTMAAVLAHIKSRLLLPAIEEDEEEQEDPRQQLIQQLLEYERFKQAAITLNAMPRIGRDVLLPLSRDIQTETVHETVSVEDLRAALINVMTRIKLSSSHEVSSEQLPVRERMITLLNQLEVKKMMRFNELIHPSEGKLGVVVNTIAVLELLKQSAIDASQAQVFGPIYLKRVDPS